MFLPAVKHNALQGTHKKTDLVPVWLKFFLLKQRVLWVQTRFCNAATLQYPLLFPNSLSKLFQKFYPSLIFP